MSIHRRRRLVAAAALLLVPSLGGCWQGSDATTSLQDETGNATIAEAGSVTVQALNVVAGNTGSGQAALTTTLINPLGPTDTLEAVTVDGAAGELSGPIEVPGGGTVFIGTDQDQQVDFTGFSTPAGEYAEITMSFAAAGEVTVPVLVVPPVGFYEPVAPADTTPEPRPTVDVHGGEE